MVEAWAVRLRYTPKALAELEQILTDIAVQSPQGARRVQARIQTIAKLLLEFPNSGQLTSVPNLQRAVATPYPYMIFYQQFKPKSSLSACGMARVIRRRHRIRYRSAA